MPRIFAFAKILAMTHKANLNQTLAITLLRYASQEMTAYAVATLILTRPLRGLAMTVEVNLDLQNNSMQILINLCRRFFCAYEFGRVR